MEDIFLDAQLREETGRGKVKDLRASGFIPAVIYGAGKKSLALKVSHRELMRLIHRHRLESVVVNLKIKDIKGEKTKACLIKEIQHDPVHDTVTHVDFNEISLTKAIKVNVPVVAKGEPVGVKQDGGSLEHILWEIEIECMPADIPKEFTVEVSQLKIGDAVHIKDIGFPSHIKVLSESNTVVFSVSAPIKVEEVAPAVEGQEAKEPEVIKEKKEVPAEGQDKEEEAKKEKDKKEK